MTTTKKCRVGAGTPITAGVKADKHSTRILHRRHRRVNITLTRDFWGIIAILVTLIMLPVLHMLLCMWGGVA